MTIKELMQQDPREFFGFEDPRVIQELLAEVHDEMGDRSPNWSSDQDDQQPLAD